MTPLRFSVSLAGAQRTPAATPRPAEFVVEVAADGFQGSVVQGLPDEKIYQAQPAVIEARPAAIEAQPSPCLLTPPASQEPQHDDGWFFHD